MYILVSWINVESTFIYFEDISPISCLLGYYWLCTAKRILERLGIQTLSSFVFLILKPISIFLVLIWLGFLSRNFWSLLNHDLMASIWEKAISILAGNLNSSRSYLITAVVKPPSMWLISWIFHPSFIQAATFIRELRVMPRCLAYKYELLCS